MNFNELIKTKRKEKELTQETLAEMIGTTKQTIANWENDRSKPQLTDDEMIDNIAKTLDISKKEIIESITGLNNTSENYNKETINYPFLPDELINLKLSEKEIEILFAIEYLEKKLAIDNFNDKYKKYGDYLCESTSSSSGEYYKQKLTYNDYVKILGSGRNVLSIKKYIDNILKVIDLNILLDIIRKNNLKEFNIQTLSKKDVFRLLKNISNFKQDFANVCNYLNKNIVFLSEPYDYEGKRYLFKSLYIDGKIIDHLWVYDIKEDLIIGNTYEIKGTVEIYTKEVEGKDMKNYGIKVNEINKI